METQKHGFLKKIGKQVRAGTFLVLMALVASVLVTGCGGKKKSGGPAYVPPPIHPGGVCPGCSPNGQFVMSGVGFVRTGGSAAMELGLEFYSNSYSGVAGNSSYYNGEVYAYGTLTVIRNDWPDLCNIPVGTYTLCPYSGQPGTLGGAASQSLYNLQLEAVGPRATLIVALPSNYVLPQAPPVMGSGGKSYPFLLQGKVYIQPQGLQCYSNSFTLY